MNTLDYIIKKYKPDLNGKSPIMIPAYTRSDLARLFNELGFKTGAEIGVEQGFYSQELCRAIPGLKLFCVDPWQQYREYRRTMGKTRLEGFYQEAKDRLSKYDCTLVRKFSMDAVRDFTPNTLDFVYIDGNHRFEYVMEDIIHWAKIVKPGGIVSGHDYKPEANENTPFQVIQATNAYADANKINPWFVFSKEEAPSWFWVKK